MQFVDTHCHLDLIPNIQKEASREDALPIKTITVTNSPTFFDANNKLFGQTKNIRVALGLHPELVFQYQNTIDVFRKCISATKYIGEVGIDGSKEHSSNFALQSKIFDELMGIVKLEGNKIITVHSRSAVKETVNILRNRIMDSDCKIILHWFTGSTSEIKSALDIGCYFSINHKMLDSQRSRENIKLLPVDRILTETDAPFTFTERVTNRLASLEIAVTEIANLHRKDTQVMKDQIYTNFKKILSQ